MCGRYRNTLSWTQLRELMVLARPEASEAPNLEPQDDIRPTTAQWVIRQADDGLEALRMRWWLVPYFHKGKALKEWKATTFNARAETVASAPTFKGALARRRCLVPASGWDEWTGPKGSKQRWTFTAKDGAPLTLAGLWDRCETFDCGVVESFTIITQPSGSPLNAYHDRAPVVIWAADREHWLTPGADVTKLIGPESVDLFDVRPALLRGPVQNVDDPSHNLDPVLGSDDPASTSAQLSCGHARGGARHRRRSSEADAGCSAAAGLLSKRGEGSQPLLRPAHAPPKSAEIVAAEHELKKRKVPFRAAVRARERYFRSLPDHPMCDGLERTLGELGRQTDAVQGRPERAVPPPAPL